jgi:putative alpha-1,2-mannosidase
VETPYYYSTRFDDSLIQTEFTPTEHCGYFRFTFPSSKPVVLLANRRGGDLSSDGNSISGTERITGEGERSADNVPNKSLARKFHKVEQLECWRFIIAQDCNRQCVAAGGLPTCDSAD